MRGMNDLDARGCALCRNGVPFVLVDAAAHVARACPVVHKCDGCHVPAQGSFITRPSVVLGRRNHSQRNPLSLQARRSFITVSLASRYPPQCRCRVASLAPRHPVAALLPSCGWRPAAVAMLRRPTRCDEPLISPPCVVPSSAVPAPRLPPPRHASVLTYHSMNYKILYELT